MTEKKPLVSIGLPVYNGEKYLKQAIRSILVQTFTDFELIISDNASTDRTAEICQQYAALDARVRYYRNVKNIGGGENHILTYKLSRGKYFRWAADDDICHPRLIEQCASILELNPSIVLCYTAVVEIDEMGDVQKVTTPNRGLSLCPPQRFRQVSNRKHRCEESYGLMRSAALDKTSVKLQYTGADRALLAELSLYGRFYQIQEPLFCKRYHLGNIYLDYRSRMEWYKPDLTTNVVFPNWLEFHDYFSVIQRAPLSLPDKLQCYVYILGPWLFSNGKRMLKDIYIAAYLLLHSKKWRRQYYAKTHNWS